jgi:uncharacterized zinc-type alcohol dehydrogenase-like protein
VTPVKAYAATSATSRLEPYTILRREPAEDDVVIDIAYCGVCHTDIHMSRNGWGSSRYPMVPGHEITGVVRATGASVTKFRAGDRVGVGCFVDGGTSIGACAREHEQYHTESLVLTYGAVEHDGKTPTYGGYSQAITVKEDYVLRIPAELPLDAAAPLLCAGITLYSALKHWRAGPQKKVAIVGFGGLGHIGVKLAHALGAHVTVLSQSLRKEMDARRMGADDYVSTSSEAALKALARRFDLLINTVAAPIDLSTYLELLAIDGSLVQVGVPDEAVPLKAFPLILGRRSLAGSSIGSIAETQEMLDFCARRSILAEIETITMRQINEAFERVLKSDVRYRFVIDIASLRDT